MAHQRREQLHHIHCVPRSAAFLFDRPGHIGWGYNSGFGAMNLAMQFGATRLLLVGFDLTMVRGIHWHGKHPPGLNNPKQAGVERWRRILDDQADYLATRGIEVIVASGPSALVNYPRQDLMEAIDALPTRAGLSGIEAGPGPQTPGCPRQAEVPGA
ncbi:hypothetical protein TVVG_00028 [Tetraselmis viridis virus SI1]|uniref:alpha-2;3-sialyltransferase n=1 Tax=Tetraselmis viridis virus S20 TaxID=754070 RepID=UPI0002C0A1B2|nr:alpha-2;3-sialyltransferase [Tetraselmis viridis virus S20]AGH31377.1 hypothetical protein TVGG_00049 [Tetraselmis viridis virus S20]AGH31411.1 hypothetical protein TVVG_00028 [Tetraselmis viridis virus SI1]